MEQTNSAIFVWEIEKFANKTSYENSIKEDTYIKIKHYGFFLGIHFTCKGESFHNQIALVLNQYPHCSVNVMYEICLINEKGEECFASESSTSFAGKTQHATKGGLYRLSRDYILNPENRLLPGGKLTVKCELTLLNDDNVARLPKLSIPDVIIQKKAFANYQSLLESGKYSDVVFAIGKKEFKLHKNILAAQSPVFLAMFESGLEESKSNRVDISDIQLEVFEVLVRFIYTTNLDSVDKYALDLFEVADMYQLDSLKDICAQLLLSTNLTIDSVVNILLLADMHNSSELKSKCIRFVTKNYMKVIETEKWKEMMKNQKNFELVKELYHDIAISK